MCAKCNPTNSSFCPRSNMNSRFHERMNSVDSPISSFSQRRTFRCKSAYNETTIAKQFVKRYNRSKSTSLTLRAAIVKKIRRPSHLRDYTATLRGKNNSQMNSLMKITVIFKLRQLRQTYLWLRQKSTRKNIIVGLHINIFRYFCTNQINSKVRHNQLCGCCIYSNVTVTISGCSNQIIFMVHDHLNQFLITTIRSRVVDVPK